MKALDTRFDAVETAAGEVAQVRMSAAHLNRALRELQAVRAVVEVTGLAFLGELGVVLPLESLSCVLSDIGRRLGALEDLLGYDGEPVPCFAAKVDGSDA